MADSAAWQTQELLSGSDDPVITCPCGFEVRQGSAETNQTAYETHVEVCPKTLVEPDRGHWYDVFESENIGTFAILMALVLVALISAIFN